LGCNCALFTIDDDTLQLKREPYTGDELRLDGYYYYAFNDSQYVSTYFFYRNGICLYGTATEPENLDELEERFKTGKFYNAVKNDQTCWGVFQVDSDKIVYERWTTSSGGFLPAYRYVGTILNDTTFHIDSSLRVDGTDGSVYGRLFKFKEFNGKPDSTTPFID
jgi:hypothetical protein